VKRLENRREITGFPDPFATRIYPHQLGLRRLRLRRSAAPGWCLGQRRGRFPLPLRSCCYFKA